MRSISFLVLILSNSILQSEQPDVRGIKVVAKDVQSGGLQELHLYDRMFALVIGIDHYGNGDINLKYAVNDARAVAEVLEKEFRFEKVLTLYNEQATQAGIVQKIHELSRMTYDNDAVVIFFAGHGTQVEGRERKSLGYLIPHDGGFEEQKDSFARNVSMNTIVSDWSNLIKAKHIFYVMDSCYSGLMASTRAVGVNPVKREYTYLKEMTREPVRIVLTAGTAGQQVLDGGKGGHSVFTHRFIEALRSQKDFVTGLEVAAQIKRKVMADASGRGHQQTPDYARLVGLGDFVFVPEEESLESLKAKLAAVRKSIEEKQGRVKEAELKREQAEIRTRLAAVQHREELRRKAEQDAEFRAAEEAERRREVAEMQRKLSEARAKEAVARAKYMTIGAAISEVDNILARIRETEADIDKDYEPLLAKLGASKDPFEKTATYRKRIGRRDQLVNEEIPQAKRKRIEGFKKAIDVLNGNEFLVERSEVKLNLDSRLYDADNEVYHVELGTADLREPRKLALPIPPDGARKLYTAWKSKVLIYRVYDRLELPADLAKGKVESPIARAELRLPNSENPYLLYAGYVIDVHSEPGAAGVTVEPAALLEEPGKTSFTTPCRIVLKSEGKVSLRFQKRGYLAQQKQVTISRHGLVPVKADLPKLPVLKLRTEPPGAKVTIYFEREKTVTEKVRKTIRTPRKVEVEKVVRQPRKVVVQTTVKVPRVIYVKKGLFKRKKTIYEDKVVTEEKTVYDDKKVMVEETVFDEKVVDVPEQRTYMEKVYALEDQIAPPLLSVDLDKTYILQARWKGKPVEKRITINEEREYEVVLQQAFPGFEIPITSKDGHGNPIRKGNDPKSGLSLEIRHKGTGMHFILCPAGSFSMGSNDGSSNEKPIHKVTLSKPFYIGKYEVTQAEWKKITGKSPSHFDGANNPVEQVSWENCQEFLKKLSVTGAKFSLPTEAQWEYACRAGTTTRFSCGNRDTDLNDHAWFSSNAGRKTHPVGSRKPNSWSIHDMHGNVWEWCEDVWHDSYNDAPDDGRVWSSGDSSRRVRRGG
ncbi:MAG: SUMF1/EgtB/PvdO family nonheme iron enzyme, partial [Planctomycetota bacterium]|nr:SUMF1/EgtB/PvdO family nonheme iron enzyme [Planctomycetota bacterium]